MAVVAGVIFFIVRAFFALIPGLAGRAPIKKWAALAALLVTGFYLILSGNQVATQRSFIMIAGYERGAIKLRGRADSSLGARAALWGVNEIVGLTIASLLAGLATTPYAAFHFHRVTPYGVLANLPAMPIVSA